MLFCLFFKASFRLPWANSPMHARPDKNLSKKNFHVRLSLDRHLQLNRNKLFKKTSWIVLSRTNFFVKTLLDDGIHLTFIKIQEPLCSYGRSVEKCLLIRVQQCLGRSNTFINKKCVLILRERSTWRFRQRSCLRSECIIYTVWPQLWYQLYSIWTSLKLRIPWLRNLSC